MVLILLESMSFQRFILFLHKEETQKLKRMDRNTNGPCVKLARHLLCVHTTGKSHDQSQHQRDKELYSSCQATMTRVWRKGDTNKWGSHSVSSPLPLKNTGRKCFQNTCSSCRLLPISELLWSQAFLSLPVNMFNKLNRGSGSFDRDQRGDLGE